MPITVFIYFLEQVPTDSAAGRGDRVSGQWNAAGRPIDGGTAVRYLYTAAALENRGMHLADSSNDTALTY